VADVLTLGDIARLTGGTILCGREDLEILGIAALDAASAKDVSFLGNPKYHAQFLATSAGAVVVPRGVSEGPPSTALVAVENPSLAFAALVRHFAERAADFTPGIHPRACVDPDASIDPATCRVHAGAVIGAGAVVGDGTEIGPNAVVGEHVRIGRDCRLMANAVVRERCVLGDRVILQPGAVVGSDGYGYEPVDGRHVKIDQVGIVELHDDVEIGANTTIDRARFGKTVVGEGTKIDNLVQIAHNCVIGKHCLVIAQTGLAGSSIIGDHVTIAAQSGVAGHVSIGDGATLAARSGVSKSIAGGIIYGGKPAIPILENRKQQVCIRRLPEILNRLKALEKSLLPDESVSS